MSDFLKKAMEYKQQTGSISFFVSFIVGLLLIFAAYLILQILFGFVGLPATIIIIAIISYIIGRKL